MCDITHFHAWHDSFQCVTWFIHTWLIHLCDMTDPHVWHALFTKWKRSCVTWLIHLCDMSPQMCEIKHHVRRDSTTFQWTLNSSQRYDSFPIVACTCTCVTCLIHMCITIYSYIFSHTLLHTYETWLLLIENDAISLKQSRTQLNPLHPLPPPTHISNLVVCVWVCACVSVCTCVHMFWVLVRSVVCIETCDSGDGDADARTERNSPDPAPLQHSSWYLLSFICVTWHIGTFDMSHWYLWHDSFVCDSRHAAFIHVTIPFIRVP